MFGFVFGTACLIGLVALISRGHRHGCHGHHGRRFGRGRGRFLLNALLDRLDTTPGQEKVVRETVEGFVEELHGARREFRGSRVNVAQAVRGAAVDTGALQNVFEKQDQTIAHVRSAAVTAFGKIHETLDERQRKILADLIESGPFSHGYGH
ncbi:MAG TPA: periplasmic heavy metal sensor [Polyangiaceae bacterium]|jgi:hypothetical protein